MRQARPSTRQSRFAIILTFALIADHTLAASHKHKSEPVRSAPRIIPGLGSAHHPVSTKNRQAQEFFDQGLALVYGFNHDEAKRSFEHAAKLDPNLAMAWWGVALALGPNYNFPVDPEREKAAFEAIQKALGLQENASEAERAYINALAFRFSNDPKADLHQLDAAYRGAMAKLVQRYPDDLDGATLYADSIMNLHPWELWGRNGQPNEGTEEVLAVLEGVLARNPNHLGANHLYIHAVESSPRPERGLASAARLENLAPAAGHLVHMPSHIYSRVGDYAGAARVNERAATADEAFFAITHQQGLYPMMLYPHNLHFLVYANCMRGNFAEARRAADKLADHVRPAIKEMEMLQGFVVTPYIVLITFDRWNDILRLPPPDPSLVYTAAQWHFARAMAFAGLKKRGDAEREQKAFVADLAKLPPDAKYDQFNSATEVARVQENLLAAAIIASGAKEGTDEKEEGKVIDALQHAITAEDNLHYNEPPAWFPPVRPLLGRVLLERGKAAAAEKVFRSALEKNPRYSRALAGLRDSLKAQGREYEANLVEQQLHDTEAAVASPKSRRR